MNQGFRLPSMIVVEIYVDADGCPVKDEVYRVAKRYGLKVFVVANAPLKIPTRDDIEGVVVKGNLDAADDWIAEHIQPWDIAITTDIPLADRCLQRGAGVLSPTGKRFTQRTIGNSLATRELMKTLRMTGEITGGPASFKPADRSRFLMALDEEIQRSKRESVACPPPLGSRRD